MKDLWAPQTRGVSPEVLVTPVLGGRVSLGPYFISFQHWENIIFLGVFIDFWHNLGIRIGQINTLYHVGECKVPYQHCENYGYKELKTLNFHVIGTIFPMKSTLTLTLTLAQATAMKPLQGHSKHPGSPRMKWGWFSGPRVWPHWTCWWDNRVTFFEFVSHFRGSDWWP